MADTLDTAVTTTTEPETTPAAETTPPGGKEPEGKESKPESKFLQRLGKLLGINDDGGDDDGKASASAGAKKTEPAPKNGKTYTEADVQARIDAAKTQWQAEQEEQARLAKLSPEERAKAEAAKTGDEITQLKAQLLAHDLKDKAVARLSGDGYPVGLADLLPLTSEQDMTAAIDKLTDAFDAAVAAAVKERLRGKPPAGIGRDNNQTEAMRDQIATAIRGGMSNA